MIAFNFSRYGAKLKKLLGIRARLALLAPILVAPALFQTMPCARATWSKRPMPASMSPNEAAETEPRGTVLARPSRAATPSGWRASAFALV
jgi:hypothetical protein